MILSQEKYAKKLNSAVFPGGQGGPLEHVIAGKAQAFYEDLQPSFTTYIKQVVKNANAMAEVFNASDNVHVVSGGTDNHLFNISLVDTNVNGKELQNLLDSVNITTNKESIPNEPLSPFVTSGIRIGTPAVTSRGFDEEDAKKVAHLILQVINQHDDEKIMAEVKNKVKELTSAHKVN